MCGIFCCYNRSGDVAAFRPRAIALSKKQRHRGPDWSGCYMGKDTVMVHERLAIVGVGELFSGPMSCLLAPVDPMSIG
jgi:asparagine synthase (glutamine-hydrolysing)